jgi:hypothetical protein
VKQYPLILQRIVTTQAGIEGDELAGRRAVKALSRVAGSQDFHFGFFLTLSYNAYHLFTYMNSTKEQR